MEWWYAFMKSYPSLRVELLKPSGIRRFFDLADSMKGVISLRVGELDFITLLRNEISSYMKKRFEVSYSPKEEIIVTIGGSQALHISLRAILNPGDEY